MELDGSIFHSLKFCREIAITTITLFIDKFKYFALHQLSEYGPRPLTYTHGASQPLFTLFHTTGW